MSKEKTMVVPKPIPILTRYDKSLRGFWNDLHKGHGVKIETVDWKSLPMYQPHYVRGE